MTRVTRMGRCRRHDRPGRRMPTQTSLRCVTQFLHLSAPDENYNSRMGIICGWVYDIANGGWRRLCAYPLVRPWKPEKKAQRKKKLADRPYITYPDICHVQGREAARPLKRLQGKNSRSKNKPSLIFLETCRLQVAASQGIDDDALPKISEPVHHITHLPPLRASNIRYSPSHPIPSHPILSYPILSHETTGIRQEYDGLAGDNERSKRFMRLQ